METRRTIISSLLRSCELTGSWSSEVHLIGRALLLTTVPPGRHTDSRPPPAAVQVHPLFSCSVTTTPPPADSLG